MGNWEPLGRPPYNGMLFSDVAVDTDLAVGLVSTLAALQLPLSSDVAVDFNFFIHIIVTERAIGNFVPVLLLTACPLTV